MVADQNSEMTFARNNVCSNFQEISFGFIKIRANAYFEIDNRKIFFCFIAQRRIQVKKAVVLGKPIYSYSGKRKRLLCFEVGIITFCC